jgi:hypothetical protein
MTNPYGMDPDVMRRKALALQMGGGPRMGSEGLPGEQHQRRDTSPFVESPERPEIGPATPGAPVVTSEPSSKYAVRGFVQSKLDDPNYLKSPKYALGRVMQSTDPATIMTPEGQASFLERLKSAPGGFYKDARIEGDKIHYTGQRGQPVTIDYVNSYKAGKPSWQYLTSDKPGRGGPPSTAGRQPLPLEAGTMPASDSVGSLTEPSMYERLLQQIQALNGPEATDRDALMALLRQ